MNMEIKGVFVKWKKWSVVYYIALWTGVCEEVLKRRRRTTLALGAAISLIIYYTK